MTGVCALVLLVGGLSPCLAGVLRGEPVHRLVAVEALSATAVAVLLLLADAFHRSSYLDVGLILAVLSLSGSLVFARFLGRSL
ncbi:MAG: monovalent cation/H+ antiporter complex subunit F [Nocardioidaceae bacterium]